MPMHNIIPRLSETPGAIRRAAPTLGQDTDDILAGIGLDAAAIKDMRNAGVVA